MKLEEYDRKRIRKEWIQSTKEYKVLKKNIDLVQEFFEAFTNLNFSKILSIDAKLLNLSLVSSSVSTLESIRITSEIGNFSDSMTLLRKFRDDLFLYLYFVEVSENSEFGTEKNQKHKKKFHDWTKRQLNDFYFYNTIDVLKKNPKIKKFFVDFNVDDSLKKFNNLLNKFVHTKNISITFHNIETLNKENPKILLKNINYIMKYLSSVFTIILLLLRPDFAMAGDYICCLDMNQTPEENSQYWVAPIIIDFLSKFVDSILNDILDYLDENTFMYFKN